MIFIGLFSIFSRAVVNLDDFALRTWDINCSMRTIWYWFGNGADAPLISVLCLADFLPNRVSGKLSHESGNVRSLPYSCSRSQLYRLGVTSILAALPPCAFADGNYFQHLRQAQKGFVFHIEHGEPPYWFFKVYHGIFRCCRQLSKTYSNNVREGPARVNAIHFFCLTAFWIYLVSSVFFIKYNYPE